MRTPTMLGRKLTAGVTAFLLTITGLAVGVVAAPAAAADISPVKAIDSTQVSADALPTVQIDGVAWDQAINGNTVYVGGQFANARPAGAAPGTNLTPRSNLLAYNLTTGALITSFAPTLNAQVKKMALSPDGTRLYVVGQFTQVNGQNRYRVAAFNTATGALISNFAPVVNTTVNAVVATNTTVYIGGAFASSGNSFRTRLAAYNAATGALLGWAPTADSTVNAMTIAQDGTIIVGGSFQNVNSSPAYGLAKLDPVTGGLMTWNTTNLIRNAGANSAILSLKSDGDQVYGSGYHFGSGGNLEGIFSADAVTGDIKWVEDCHGDTYDVWPGSANTVYSVSHAHYCGNLGGFPQSEPNWGVNMKRTLAFTKEATGTLGHDPHGYYDFYGTPSPSMVNWFPLLSAGSYTGKSQAAWSVTGNSQYVVLGGEFPSVNGQAQQGLVRFAVRSIAPNQAGPIYSGSQSNPSLVALPSGKVRVAWQANTDRDDLTLNYTLTRNGATVNQATDSSPFWARANMGYIDSNVVAGQSYTYRLTATDPSGNIARSDNVSITVPAGGSTNAYAQQVLADGASSYWPMNESSGTALLDNAGFNDIDIDTATGITRGTAGAITGDPATTFDGATSSSTRTPIPGPNTFTSQVWIKTTTTSGGKILGFGGSKTGNSGSYDRHVYMDNSGRIWFGVYPNGVATLNSSTSYNDGQWHQITTTLGPDGMKLYIDAKLIGQRGDVTWGQDYSGYWRVGGDNIGGWPSQPASNTFAGAIDDVAIYPTVLSRQAINNQWVASGRTSTIPAAPADSYGAAVFNDNPTLFWRLGESSGTTAADSGPNGDQTGSYQGGVTLGTAGGIKGTTNTAASFDGSDDFVASTNTYGNPKNYSLEAWFKTTATNGKIIGFGNSNSGTSNNYDRHVYLESSGAVTFGVWTGFTNTITTPKAYNDGVWHHVVATQSSTDGMKLYLDGTLAGTNGQTDAQAYDGYWRVGGDNNWGGGPFVNATIDDAAVYGSVLTGAQVANHFNLGNTVVAPNQAPVAEFTSSSVYLDATFTNTSSDPDGTIAAAEWDFGDSTPVSTATSPTHSYAEAGTYNVSLKVTDDRGETNVVTHPVVVTAPPANVPPTAGISVTSQNLLTVNVSGSGSADSDGSIVDYAWDFGDSGTANGLTASHTYTAAGTYTVSLTVKDNDGASTTTTQSVTVSGPANQAPVANFTLTPAQLTVTVDGSTSTDPDGSITAYAWDFGDGGTATGAKPAAHTYLAAGSYTVTLTVTDNKGSSHSKSEPVTVTAPPANVPPSAGFQQLVDGLTVNLNSTSTDQDGQIVTWEWDFGDNVTDTDTGADVVHTYATSGTYQVTLKVTDNSGASTSTQQNVAVTAPVTPNNPPTAAFTSSTNNLTVSVNGAGSTDADGSISSYSWEFGDGTTDQVTTATATHTYLAAGTYPVTLTVTDDDGATNSKTIDVTVTSPAPVALVSDAFGRTVTNGFGTADTGGNWTIAGGNSNFSVNNGTGNIRIPTAGSTLTAALGQVTSADVDITLQMALDKPATGGGLYASVSARKVGNTEYRVSPRFTNTGGIQVQLIKVVGGTATVLQTTTLSSFGYVAGEQVTLRFKVVGSSSVTLQSKIWKSSSAEPAAWQTTATDANAPLTTPGTLQLIAYMSGSSTNAPVVVKYDNVKVFAVTP